ncbi:transcription elongation factor [Rubritalea tangerina]|uniref:Transcription elongation factor n=1 Tax=Rubritalea tangerina TaxID=430798 RepID=A0ABW4Z762_9BACT
MSDNKSDLIQQVITSLEADLDVLRKAAQETHSNSTDEQSKAEGKYDTRGLEASYLAEAQAGKVLQLEDHLRKLKQLDGNDYDDSAPIASGSMVILSSSDDDYGYMLLPAGGGMTLLSQGLEFTVVTPDSPIGSLILGKHVGNTIDHPQYGNTFISDLW